MDDEKCCGTCKWHIRETTYGEFVCNNEGSDYFTDWTEFGDSCSEWEERQ